MSFLAEWHKQQNAMKDAERNNRKNATALMNTYNSSDNYVQRRPGHDQLQDRERERERRGTRFPVAGEQLHEQDSINSIASRRAIFEKEQGRKQKQKPRQHHTIVKDFNCDDSNLNGNDNDDSVINIQSLIRGHLCRTRVNKMLQKLIDEIQIEKTKRKANGTETQTQTAAQHSSKTTATLITSTLIQVEDDKANVTLSTEDVSTSTSTATATATTVSTSMRENAEKKNDGGGGDSDTIINEIEEEKKYDDDEDDDEDDVLSKMMIEEGEEEKSNDDDDDDDDNNVSCCVFCLESPIKFDEYTKIDCGSGCYHNFCFSCIDRWSIEKASTCPYCRKTFHNIICVNDGKKSKKVDFREQQRYRQQQGDNGTIEDDDDDLLDVNIHIGGAEVGEGYTLRIDSGLSLVLPGNDNDYYHVAYITE